MEVKQVTSTPKCCSSRIAYSRRLAALSTDKAAFEQSLLTELRRAIKVEIERKYFSGSGSSDQPLGIYNTSGIGSKTLSRRPSDLCRAGRHDRAAGGCQW